MIVGLVETAHLLPQAEASSVVGSSHGRSLIYHEDLDLVFDATVLQLRPALFVAAASVMNGQAGSKFSGHTAESVFGLGVARLVRMGIALGALLEAPALTERVSNG